MALILAGPAVAVPALDDSDELTTTSSSGASGGNVLAFPAITSATGNTNVLHLRYNNATTVEAITDSQGNTYTLVCDQVPIGNIHSVAYKAVNVTGNASQVITIDFSGTNAVSTSGTVATFSGLTTSPADDEDCQNTASSTSQASPTITTTEAGDLLVGFIGTGNGRTFTQGDSATEIQVQGAGQLVYRIAGAAGSYSQTWTISSADVAGTGIIALKAASAGELTGAPTVTAQDTNDYTISGTTDAAVTVYFAACIKDQTAPTGPQVAAGDCTGDVNAIASGSESWNGSDSFVLGGSLTRPIHDLYVWDGTTLYTLADEYLDPPAGYAAYQAFASLGAETTNPITGTDQFNATETPDLVNGDIFTWTTATAPSAYVVTGNPDGNIEYVGDATPETVYMIAFDLSADGYHASATSADPWRLDLNWEAPEAVATTYTSGPLRTGEAITAINLITELGITDPQDSTITATVQTGTISDGLTLSSAGSITGTPTTENEAGDTFTVRFTNAAGLYLPGDATITLYPWTTSTIPDCSALDAASCFIQYDAVFLSPTTTYQCHESVAANDVISQDPVATTEVEWDDEVGFLVSTGTCSRPAWRRFAVPVLLLDKSLTR